MKNTILNIAEVRRVNTNVETGRINFHTIDGRTIVRTIEKRYCHQFNNMLRADKNTAYEYAVALFNEKYSEPQLMKRQYDHVIERYVLNITKGY